MAGSGSTAQSARQASAEALYEAVFDALPDPAAIVDDAGRIMAANAEFSRTFGSAAAPGRSLAALFADNLDFHAAPWRRSGARPYSARLEKASGAMFPAHLRSRSLSAGVKLLIIQEDALACDRAARNLTRLAETFAAPSSGAFGMNLVSGEGQISGFLARIYGLQPGERALSKDAWLEPLDEADRAAVNEALAAAHGVLFAPVRFTIRQLDPGSGRMRALRYDLTVPALDDDGRPAGLTGAVTDVTDLSHAVQAARDAERRLALLSQAAGAATWRFEPHEGEGRIEGPLADQFAGPGFAWPQWSACLEPDDARRLNAAICAAEYGGSIDLAVTLKDGGSCRICGERLSDGAVAGFVLAEGPAGSRGPDTREAALSAVMSAWTYDIASRTLRLTGPVLALLGLPGREHEMDIGDWRARVPEADLPQMDLATASLNDQGVADVEYRVRTQDGRLVWLNLRGGISEQDADGVARRYSGFLSEVGERKRLEHQIAMREQQLADAVDAGLIGIWTYDYATGTQTARGRVLDWMGKPRDAESVDSEDWLTVIHPDDQDALRKAFAAMAGGAPVERLDVRLKSPDGWRWGRTHGSPVEAGPEGAPRRAAGVIVDIHAEHAFREALQSEKARFETVYRATPALLHSIDAEGRTTIVSDYWLKRMGYGRDEVIGAPGWFFMDEASARRIQDTVIPQTLARGWIENEPVVGFTASGDRLELRLSAFTELGPDGTPVAAHGVFSDVTDLKLTQRELEAHAEALERTNRELDRFATVASHDLQEPLRKISAFASLLERQLSGEIDPESQQALDFLIDAAGRMRVLIDDLLAYSRASNRAVELKPVPMAAFMTRVLTGLDLQIADAGAEIHVRDLPDVIGDEVLLGLLFQNLIANALKYGPEDDAEIRVDGRVDDEGFALIEVADNGIGFDMAFAEKIFEPFARLHTREQYSGTGIGLAICQQAAERMGGRIDVRSAPGEGSVFTVRLPCDEAAPQPE
ncbi:MAG: PAS domain S-box protein [Alphaproteobacteria bacterium]|nr:PAS domain S-box protein [Alphaproteobacteria bacterium]